MSLHISNKVYISTAILAAVALGVYVYTSKPQTVVPDSDVESEHTDSDAEFNSGEEKE